MLTKMDRLKICPEAYFMPKGTLQVILDILQLKGTESILEPCAGEGNIVKHLRDVGHTGLITAIEYEKEFIPELEQSGANQVICSSFFWPNCDIDSIGLFDVAIINPPFTKVEKFILHAYDYLKENGRLVVLMRLAHLVGVKRYSLFENCRPTSIYLLNQRPSFTGTSSDIGGYLWALFDKPMTTTDTIVKWVPIKNEYRGSDR